MAMKVNKFGGAAVRNADAVRNLVSIVKTCGFGTASDSGKLLLVVSAMGKTTNMLEGILSTFRSRSLDRGHDREALSELILFHTGIMTDLFPTMHPVFFRFEAMVDKLYSQLCRTDLDYDSHYDQTVCFGELISTMIVAEYLNFCDMKAKWLDARRYVITDRCCRSANVDWEESGRRIASIGRSLVLDPASAESGPSLVLDPSSAEPGPSFGQDYNLYVTQGFIGSCREECSTTTLGREGSDYSAAIFAHCMGAEEVTIWKDVDGLLNADPKRFPNTVKIPHLSYAEAIELAFYGASIIHPKTLKPLQNKGIRLYVRSFVHPDNPPTVIDSTDDGVKTVPSYIVKDNQTLVSFSPRDYSFMNEHNLKTIFSECDDLHIHANMIQISALMLSICIDSDGGRLRTLMDRLSDRFSIKYNDSLQLFTIRHYDEDGPSEIRTNFLKGREILVKQGSRSTLQFVVR